MAVSQVTPFKKFNHCKLVWLIQNVYQCRRLRKSFIAGPEFETKCASPFPWALKLGQSETGEQKGISLYIYGLNMSKEITANCHVFLRKQNNVQPLIDEKFQAVFDSERTWRSPILVTNDEFEKEPLNEKPCDFWEMHVELTWNEIIEPEMNITDDDALDSLSNLLCCKEVGTDLKQFYKSARFSDIYIRCDDKEIPAHKAILDARCPYFAQKLNSYSGGDWEGTVIGLSPPRDPEVMNSFLMYLYTGDIESLMEGGPLPIGVHKCAQRMKKYDLEWLASPLQLCGYSRVTPRSIGHAWNVGNVYEIFKQKNESQVICTENLGDNKTSFTLSVKHCKSKHSEDCISVFLQLDKLEKGDGIYVIFELSVDNSKSRKVSKKSAGDLTPKSSLGFPEFGTIDSFSGTPNVVLLVSIYYFEDNLSTDIDKMSLNCVVKSDKESDGVSLTSVLGNGCHGWVNLSWDLGQLLESKKHSDCVVVVGEDRFPAHRVVLAARSRYFSALFDVKEGECADSSKGMEILVEKDIKISPETMKNILEEIYTGSYEVNSESAKNIYDFAKFFGLKGLEMKCKKYSGSAE